MLKFASLLDVIESFEPTLSTIRGKKFRLVKPSWPHAWEYTMRDCRQAIDILYAFNKLMKQEKDNYTFNLDWRLFYKSTSIDISYNERSRTFSLTYGYPIGTKNTHDAYSYFSDEEKMLELAKFYQKCSNSLADEMKKELKWNQFTTIMQEAGFPQKNTSL